jgi:hypothetical protein
MRAIMTLESTQQLLERAQEGDRDASEFLRMLVF